MKSRVITGLRYPRLRQDASANFWRQKALLCALLLALSCPLPANAVDEGLIRNGPRSKPWVALTFDVCQTPGRPTRLDTRVVDVLHDNRVPATLFIGGDWLRTHPDESWRLATEPLLELANHSWSHPDLRHCTPAQIVAEVRRTDDELYRRTGRRSALFRLPFGYYRQATLEVLASLGVKVIQWEVVSGDPDRKMTAAKILRTVRRGVRPGSIIIMHANGRGWHTAEALPGILALLRARGLQPVTVSQLLAAELPTCRIPLAPGACALPPQAVESPQPAFELFQSSDTAPGWGASNGKPSP